MEEENTCICLALVTSGNSQTTTKCLLLEDANWTIFPESKEHRTGLHAAQLPAGRHALHHQVTDENNLEMLSRGKPLHGFLCPVCNFTCWQRATAAIPQFSSLLLFKETQILQPSDRPPKPEVNATSRRSDGRKQKCCSLYDNT